MIVVSAKEAKESSGLSQLLLGKQGTTDTKFASFLEAFNLSGNLENEEFNLENILEKVVRPKNINTKISDSHLLVVDTKIEEKSIVSVKTDSQTVLKETTLLHLLQGEDVSSTKGEQIQSIAFVEEDESHFLHPKMINTLEPKDIKLVINSAKTYLKEQIGIIVKEQNIDVKSMPQTLKGLSEMAKKLGVNLEKITLETIIPPKIKEQVLITKESIPLLDMKKQESYVRVLPIKSSAILKENEIKKEDPLRKALHVKSSETFKTEPLHVKGNEDKKVPIKVNTSKVVLSTSEVNSIADTVEVLKPAKPIQANPLSALLHTDEVSEDDNKVFIKTSITETKISQSSFVNVLDADSLEVKSKEAQQMVRHFASEMKEAVENYKPPFTRLKMTLNPAKLGEIDVTLIQRGSNVHINISSNNTAVTLLANNVNELKTQLANNGVVNTSMQFSTSHGEHQQREGQHQQFQAYKDFDQLSEEELEMITSMEIILPRYV